MYIWQRVCTESACTHAPLAARPPADAAQALLRHSRPWHRWEKWRDCRTPWSAGKWERCIEHATSCSWISATHSDTCWSDHTLTYFIYVRRDSRELRPFCPQRHVRPSLKCGWCEIVYVCTSSSKPRTCGICSEYSSTCDMRDRQVLASVFISS